MKASEREGVVGGGFFGGRLGLFYFGLVYAHGLVEPRRAAVDGKPPYDYRLAGQDGADVLACPAAYADVPVDVRNVEAVLRVAKRYHFDRLHGAVFGARRAVRAVGFYDAQILVKNSGADFLVSLVVLRNELYRARGACVGTVLARVQAESGGVVHVRAHQPRKPPLPEGGF